MPNPVVVQPIPGINGPKTLDDWRALFHEAVPVIVSTLVGINLVTNDQVSLWLPFLFAIADPLLSVGNAQDKLRRVIYGLIALLQGSSAVVAVLTTNPQVPQIVTAVATILGASFARFNTPTSSMTPKT